MNVHAQRTGKLVTHLDPEAVEALVAYDWPGNIRELENVLERAVVLADGPAVTLDDLPPELRQPVRRAAAAADLCRRGGRAARRPAATRAGVGDEPGPGPRLRAPSPTALEPIARRGLECRVRRLRTAAAHRRPERSQAATRASPPGCSGMPRSTFFSKLKKHGIALIRFTSRHEGHDRGRFGRLVDLLTLRGDAISIF